MTPSITPFIQFGAIGACLIWFMFRAEPRLRSIESAIDRMSRSILLLVISLPSSNPTTKEQSKGIEKELDEAQKLREK